MWQHCTAPEVVLHSRQRSSHLQLLAVMLVGRSVLLAGEHACHTVLVYSPLPSAQVENISLLSNAKANGFVGVNMWVHYRF